MRELPKEDDGKHNQRAPFQSSTSSGPTQHARHGSGERTHKCADGMNFLQWSVAGEINTRGNECQPSRKRIECPAQVNCSAEHHQSAYNRAVQPAEASSRDRSLSSAAHAAVSIPLHHFVKSSSSARNQTDT